MCGRYSLIKLAQVLASFPWVERPAEEDPPRYNIAPSQGVLAALNMAQPRFEHLRWGLIPSWAGDARVGNRMINARAETLSQRPAFRAALRSRRCLIPADGFYEWQGRPGARRQPYYLRMKSRKVFAFAGLWDVWHDPAGGDIRTCAIITTEPNELVRTIYNRMPVILAEPAQQEWLQEKPVTQLSALLAPYPAGKMEMFAVSPAVNKPTADGPECIAPAPADGGLFS